MSGRVSIDLGSARRYVQGADDVARKLAAVETRVSTRALPPMPEPHRGQVAAMRVDTASTLRRSSNRVSASATELDVRIARFTSADRFGLGGSLLELLESGGKNWWLHPLWLTPAGVSKAFRRDGAHGLARYFQRSGAGKKGSLVRKHPYLKKSLPADKLIRHGGKVLGPVGHVLNYKSTYDSYRTGGDSEQGAHTVAGSAVVGGVAGGVVGAAVGSALIPIPGVGAVVGGAVGSAIGSHVGEKVGNTLKKVKMPKLW